MISLYLDANIFITWLKKEEEEDPKFYQGVKQLLREIEEGKYQVIASSILLTEILYGEKEDIEHFNELFDGFEVYPVDTQVANKAKSFRIRFSIETPDAIHLATAVMQGANYFCTKDTDFDSVPEKIKNTKIVKLPPLTPPLPFPSSSAEK